MNEAFGGTEATMRSLQGLTTLMDTPPLRALLAARAAMPRQDVELKATNLPAE